MPNSRRKRAAVSDENVYKKAEDLPEGRRKEYDTILEDFDKQVEARIEQNMSALSAMQNQIKSQVRVALLQLPKTVRSLQIEEYLYNKEGSSSDVNLTVELAKVAANVTNSITNKVTTTVKGGKKSSNKGGRRTTKKKSSILAQAPPSTGVRRSTRKRIIPSHLGETPLASSTLTAAALGTTTAKSSRSKALTASSLQTPATGSKPFGSMPVITPKFDPTTPMTRTVMRAQKADEKWLVSLNGSPVYIGPAARGGRGAKVKGNDNMMPVPLGGGKTLMVPTDAPEVQPLVQQLVQSCMTMIRQ